jgi:hypothetical protein
METRHDTERTLARLGIEEIEERLEISPVIAGDQPVPEDPGDGGCCCSYTCKLTSIDPSTLRW